MISSDDRTWIIYKYTNMINNKVYIGQTKNTIKRRAAGGAGYSRNQLFGRAIQKYGWKNFKAEVLEENIHSQEEANIKEKYYIALYNSCDHDYGYNMEIGGNGSTCSEIPVYQYSLDGEYIASYQSSTIASLNTGINCACIAAASRNERKSAGGYLWTREYKESLRPYFLNTQTRPVYQYNLFGEFVKKYNNAFDAGVQFGNYASHRIIECCDGLCFYAFDYMWKYEYVEKIPHINDYATNRKVVYCYSPDGNYKDRYLSTTIAAHEMGVTNAAIKSACRKDTAMSCGYYWSYCLYDNYLARK